MRTKRKHTKSKKTALNMSNAVEFVEASIVRDEEELEGTLLPAAGGQLNGQETIPLVSAAVPEEHFEYTAEVVAQDEADNTNREQARHAFALSRGTEEYDSKLTVNYAQNRGLIATAAEKQVIQDNNRKVQAYDYYEKAAFKEAQKNAKEALRLEELGLRPAPEEVYFSTISRNTQEAPSKSKPGAPASGEYKPGGYEIKEYQMGSYETAQYDVSEYKSVYDN